MHTVAIKIIVTNGLESSRAYMQGHKGVCHAKLGKPCKHRVIKMQASCRCSHRAWVAGVYGLIAFLVLGFVGMLNVRWQWDMAKLIKRVKDILIEL